MENTIQQQIERIERAERRGLITPEERDEAIQKALEAAAKVETEAQAQAQE